MWLSLLITFGLSLIYYSYYEVITMQVKDLTTDELKTLIRETIVEALEDVSPDPDEGMIVKEEFKQELLEIQRRRKTGIRGISAEEVMKRLGLSV